MSIYSIICQIYSDSLHYNNYGSGVDKKITGIIIYVIVLIVIAVYFFNKKKDKKPNYTYPPIKREPIHTNEPKVGYQKAESTNEQVSVNNQVVTPHLTEESHVGFTVEHDTEERLEMESGIGGTETIKYIGYNAIREYDELNKGSYPIVGIPQSGSLIRFPGVGRKGRKGYKEQDFLKYLNKYFGEYFKIYTNRHLSHPNGQGAYEPDFTLINLDINMLIDIEIDEPYDGFSRKPMHTIGENKIRDDFFNERGWVVIRFAEIQVHQEPESCCRVIALILSHLDNSYEVDNFFEEVDVVKFINQWNSIQSKKWEKERYRELYLGIDSFGKTSSDNYTYVPALTELDIKIEEKLPNKYVLPQRADALILEMENKFDRDERLLFDEVEHRYFIDENPDTRSVSQLVDMFFPEFDMDYWAARKAIEWGIESEDVKAQWSQKSKSALEKGHYLHKQIENYFNNEEYDSDIEEFGYFINFCSSIDLKPFRTEWRIFDEDKLLAGTVDMVFKDNNDNFHIYDWKRSKKVVDEFGDKLLPNYSYGLGPLNNVSDNSYNKYSLQQNIYKYILESKYGVTINSMNLVIFHPNYNDFHVVEVRDMKEYVENVFNSI